MSELANIYNSKTGASVELNQNSDGEVWGIVDAWFLEHRCGFRPMISLEEMIDEALEDLWLLSVKNDSLTNTIPTRYCT